MKFHGTNDQTVEMKIAGYQYPQISDGDDGNWLNIYLNVRSGFGNWQVTDPSLTTADVSELANWFAELAIGEEPQYTSLAFMEPNISFKLMGMNYGMLSFRIVFSGECAPLADLEDHYVDCLADSHELERICNELQLELLKFPER